MGVKGVLGGRVEVVGVKGYWVVRKGVVGSSK